MRYRPQLLWLIPCLFGCGGSIAGPQLPAPLPYQADSMRSTVLSPGVTHHYLYSSSGPWAIHLLQVDLGRCNAAVAVKGQSGAMGREKTSTLLADLARRDKVVGGVNADFFLFAPPGIPYGALISRGQVVVGPSTQPVLAFDARGRPSIETLRVSGSVSMDAGTFPVLGWNRAIPDGLAWFDKGWGREMDTASGVVEVVATGTNDMRVSAIDTLTSGMAIPDRGGVLIAGRDAPASLRAAMLAIHPGQPLRARLALLPGIPREAVGGRPVLLQDGLVAGAVDTQGQPGFATARHPRTAVGIAGAGQQLLLVVVDGRQAPYSDGMTLRELARLMLALGARDAINLDGGGSTTLVFADPDSVGGLRIANRPSDQTGERPVGDALAIVRRCGIR